ncbi:hypothetical protein CLPUN_02690 [Clostridium puniceum]|uniref:Uncharacterized protein n=1 Tax=Clostridium puniceum TaxID=29367 RepID=A0A1S8TX84_9CLOT|nr:hypothetical protein [Clostridium puniceum]OOM82368.1 hypothetical protein CLPUN_02690 [Clostridium puniceum]
MQYLIIEMHLTISDQQRIQLLIIFTITSYVKALLLGDDELYLGLDVISSIISVFSISAKFSVTFSSLDEIVFYSNLSPSALPLIHNSITQILFV